MTWISGISLKNVKGPTLYIAIVSGLILWGAHALNWHLNSATIIGFLTLVGSFIWNNGKFGLGAIHKANFWITVIAALLLIINKAAGWNMPTTDIYGFVIVVAGILFHNADATAILRKMGSTPLVAAPTPPSQED